MAQHFTLPDGRNVDYVVTGAKNGFPFVFIHGTPGSYLVEPSLADLCEKKGLKLISTSRAGYGGSTRKKGRLIVDVVADIQTLLQHLNVVHCFVGGWSGGGPHALACAARLPGCIGVLCIAGVAPFYAEGLDWLAGQGEDNVKELGAAIEGEEELQKFCAAGRPMMLSTDAAGLVEAISTVLPEVDRKALLQNKGMGQYTLESIHEALRLNSDGWVDDDLAFVAPSWGFELSEVKVPVFLYHGSEDKMSPYAHGEWLAKHLPPDKVVKHLVQGEGHISIYLSFRDSMIDELLAIVKS